MYNRLMSGTYYDIGMLYIYDFNKNQLIIDKPDVLTVYPIDTETSEYAVKSKYIGIFDSNQQYFNERIFSNHDVDFVYIHNILCKIRYAIMFTLNTDTYKMSNYFKCKILEHLNTELSKIDNERYKILTLMTALLSPSTEGFEVI